jgi:aminoglycoside phosphotransferase family enzyme/predicted kinase
MSGREAEDRSNDSEPGYEAVVEHLRDPAAYPEAAGTVRLIETHISQVFLTDRFVYKLKKRVRFDFLDFRTLEKREAACRDELRLNRRMAPEAYLDVLPIVADSAGQLRLGKAHASSSDESRGGPIVDWVVYMKRLPAERMLDRLLATNRLTEDEAERLTAFLADYYARAEPLQIDGETYRRTIAHHVADNRRVLLEASEIDAELVRRIHTAQLRYLACRAELLRVRAAGHVIDGHGDLRPEHVCLTDPIAVFDCIEFSAEFRRVDVLDELGFLSMECDAAGAPEVGRRIIAAYRRHSDDDAPAELEAFYKSYRAVVRAKVATLRAAQIDGPARRESLDARDRYLNLAEKYLRAAGARPLVIVVGGMMGTGKSTLARGLSEALGMEVLRTDSVRRSLFPTGDGNSAFDEGRYRAEARGRVYDELLRLARNRLAAGVSVILDGTYLQGDRRASVRSMAEELGAESLMVRCVCSRETAMRRIEVRLASGSGDPSEARPELYDRQVAEAEHEGPFEGLEVDAAEPLPTQCERVFAALGSPGTKPSGSGGI